MPRGAGAVMRCPSFPASPSPAASAGAPPPCNPPTLPAQAQEELVQAAARLARTAANEAGSGPSGRRVLVAGRREQGVPGRNVTHTRKTSEGRRAAGQPLNVGAPPALNPQLLRRSLQVAGSLPPLRESYQASGLAAFEEMQPEYNLLAGVGGMTAKGGHALGLQRFHCAACLRACLPACLPALLGPRPLAAASLRPASPKGLPWLLLTQAAGPRLPHAAAPPPAQACSSRTSTSCCARPWRR